MPSYSRSKGGSISGGSIKKFTMDSFTVPAGERFTRFKITTSSGVYSGLSLVNDSAKIGWNKWRSSSTYVDSLHWSDGKADVWVYADSQKSTTIKVTWETEIVTDYQVTCQKTGTGTLSASVTECAMGTVVTLYPNPGTGYQLSSYTTSPAVTISNNKFTMPGSSVTITANFTKINYAINKVTNPAGAGTITAPATGQMGNTISISQVPNAGYDFMGWTISPELTITSGQFTMPNSAVTLTANYQAYATASLDKTTLTGGGTVKMTISALSPDYINKYKLSFGTGMETLVTDIEAGATSVTVQVPRSWGTGIPNALSKTGGTMTLYTYDGSTLIGTYVISDLVYNVSPDAVPEIGTVACSVARTIGGITYGNIGDYYVQGHCGVRVQTDADGSDGSSITEMSVSLSGYTGNDYSDTVQDDEIDFTSGLLSLPGTVTVTVTATDSRNRTSTKTAQITVNAYSKPSGTLTVMRCDAQGVVTDMGENGKYILTKQFTEIGSNQLTVTLGCQGYTATPVQDTGDLLPGNRLSFSGQSEFTCTMTLTDSMGETTVVTSKLASAKFIFYVDAGGNRIGFMKAANQQVPTPSGKTSTLEISADTEIYIGTQTLAEYIQSIINGN